MLKFNATRSNTYSSTQANSPMFDAMPFAVIRHVLNLGVAFAFILRSATVLFVGAVLWQMFS